MSFLSDSINAVVGWFGAEQQNRRAADAAEQAQNFSAAQFASRYQTTVSDMQKAGLNPMLAYSQGGGSPPSGVQAPVVNSGAAASENYFRSKITSAQVANVEADTANKQASADLIKGQAAQAWASAGQASANVPLIQANVDKTVQEIKNLETSNDQAKALIDNLRLSGQNLFKENLNLTEVGNRLRAEIDLIGKQAVQAGVVTDKARWETLLIKAQEILVNYDVKAAGDMGNLGRSAGQLKPVIDILMHVLKGR